MFIKRIRNGARKVEKIVREKGIMEKRYDIDIIPLSERIFTTSQETDVWELISDGFEIDEIISKIKKW